MMPLARTALALFGALAVLGAVSPARAVTVEKYLALRRQCAFNPRLTYRDVETNPTAHLDRALELRGTINGIIRREQAVSFLLTLEDRRSLLLDCPPEDIGLVSALNPQVVRVLARVSMQEASNVVPLKVIAITYNADLEAKEREEAQKQAAARAKRSTQRRAAPRSYTPTASRGYYVRQTPDLAEKVSPMARRYLSPQAQSIYPAYRQFIWNWNKRLTARQVDEITVSLLYFSERHRVDPRLVVAMIIAESDFDPYSTSHKGAMGLGQIMPDEAAAHALTNPYDPIQNIRAAVNLLRQKLDLYRDPTSRDGQPSWRQIQLALAAYNAGAGAVKRYGGIPPYRETQNYIRRIMNIYTQLIR